MNAIVTTLKNPGEPLNSFIKYHLAIGFDHIFLFFDDPFDNMIESVQNNPAITIVKNNVELRQRWSQTINFRSNLNNIKFIDTEVMARQILNVEVATQMALDLNIDWLLHVDHDELFTTNNISVAEHFSKLKDQGVTSIKYTNHESIPETINIQDPFKEVTLFKKNVKILKRDQGLFLKSLSPKEYFMFYSNGKSAGRVNKYLIPDSVHGFRNQDKYEIAFDASILHYPVCGIDRFVDKYKVLGQFDDKWFGVTEIKEHMPFHIECRDLIKWNNESLIRSFYEDRIMWRPEKVNVFTEKGVLFREYYPQNILNNL